MVTMPMGIAVVSSIAVMPTNVPADLALDDILCAELVCIVFARKSIIILARLTAHIQLAPE